MVRIKGPKEKKQKLFKFLLKTESRAEKKAAFGRFWQK